MPTGRDPRTRFRRRIVLGFAVLAALFVAAAFVWGDDVIEAFLDPKIPYAVYRPPPAPDYSREASWAHLPAPRESLNGPADVFFIHPTTFDGGKDWNGPIDNRHSAGVLERVMLPNYAAPFAATGRVFAPRYRQASLYTALSLFDDAIEAREFAYGDVRRAFRLFVSEMNNGRPIILVGVEQGGVLASRLLSEEIAGNPDLRRRLVAAYFIQTVLPAEDYETSALIPACAAPAQTHCVVAWMATPSAAFGRATQILRRSFVWGASGRLVALGDRAALCINPLLGMRSDAPAPPLMNRGAANATGLEWSARPGFMVGQVGGQCRNGILRVSRPRSASLRPPNGFIERLRVPPYNLFWADIEADALKRTAAFAAAQPASVPSSPRQSNSDVNTAAAFSLAPVALLSRARMRRA